MKNNKNKLNCISWVWFSISFTILFSSLLLANSEHLNNPDDLADENIPHLLPGLTGKDYESILANNHSFQSAVANKQNNELQIVLAVGKRNLKWLEHINKSRKDKLSFSDIKHGLTLAKTSTIEHPTLYNKKSILEDYKQVITELPEIMQQVLTQEQPFTDDVPIASKKYLLHTYKIDLVYRDAVRLTFNDLYRDAYTHKRFKDIRGYYLLDKTPWLNTKLRNFSHLPENKKENFKKHLLNLCYNTEKNNVICEFLLEDSVSMNNGSAYQFYRSYVEQSRDIYNSFFKIPNRVKRSDVKWQADNNSLATVPFKQIDDDNMKLFLKNIEHHWQWKKWQLKLDYTNSEHAPYIHFQPDQTPNVDRIGGNKITMDPNLPLTEEFSKTVIKHEFGHVLGFPDCYVEFYDPAIESYVYYNLDDTNFMCAANNQGLQKTHFLELKKNYFNS